MVQGEDPVHRHQHQPFEPGLCDQHSVERVPVMERQATSLNGVMGVDGKRLPSHCIHDFIPSAQGKQQRSRFALDGEFPRRSGADKNVIARRCKRLPEGRAELRVIERRPKQDMCVEKESQIGPL